MGCEFTAKIIGHATMKEEARSSRLKKCIKITFEPASYINQVVYHKCMIHLLSYKQHELVHLTTQSISIKKASLTHKM